VTLRNILLATDFSADAAEAFEWTLALAKPFSATVHLLHAHFVALPLEVQPGFPPQALAQLRAAARSRFEPLAKRAAAGGVACECHLVEAPALTAILELAGALPADLIAMGTRGLSGLPHVLLGSVAERAVRLAPCPVLTVKARAA
jgi:nucleotide-binding universal stress UspA family protein